MSTIVTRAGKGSALTHTEVDNNFINLNTDKIEAAQSVTLTNKTISGANNTLSNIGNASLTNSSVTIGSTSVSLGSTATTVSGLTLSSPTVSGGTIDNASVGATTASTGAFTTLSASSTVSGTGFSTYLASPPAIGGTAAAAGSFTTLSATGVATFQAGSNSAPSITTSGDTNTGIFFPAADTVAIGTGGTERLRVDSAGNLGLGVTPSAWQSNLKAIQVGNTASISGQDAEVVYVGSNIYFNGSWKYITTNTATRYQQNAGAHIWYNAPSGTAGNAITFTQAMTLTSGGDLLVGTTSGVVGSERISVNAESNRGIVLKTSSVGNELVGCWNSATSGNNRFAIFWTEASATERGSIDYNRTGGLTRYNTTSDAALKNIIGDSDGQRSLEILNTTRIREYAWKDDEAQKPQIGVVAQELYETYKGAVSVGGDIEKTDEEGNVTTEYRPWGVDKTAFTFHLIAGWQAHEKMIQELKAIVDAQAVEIAALKGTA